MTLNDLIYVTDKDMPIIIKEAGNETILYTIETLPLSWLARDVLFVTMENYEELNEEMILTIYTFNNNGYIEVYLPDGTEATFWSDGSSPIYDLFVESDVKFEN